MAASAERQRMGRSDVGDGRGRHRDHAVLASDASGTLVELREAHP